ncbi:MAG: hypothetical protein VKJ06_07885 [Vampirovibrionales bacterium]|nr:hypothetical protein [Vampirovibrionales bacterium]
MNQKIKIVALVPLVWIAAMIISALVFLGASLICAEVDKRIVVQDSDLQLDLAYQQPYVPTETSKQLEAVSQTVEIKNEDYKALIRFLSCKQNCDSTKIKQIARKHAKALTVFEQIQWANLPKLYEYPYGLYDMPERAGDNVKMSVFGLLTVQMAQLKLEALTDYNVSRFRSGMERILQATDWLASSPSMVELAVSIATKRNLAKMLLSLSDLEHACLSEIAERSILSKQQVNNVIKGEYALLNTALNTIHTPWNMHTWLGVYFFMPNRTRQLLSNRIREIMTSNKPLTPLSVQWQWSWLPGGMGERMFVEQQDESLIKLINLAKQANDDLKQVVSSIRANCL